MTTVIAVFVGIAAAALGHMIGRRYRRWRHADAQAALSYWHKGGPHAPGDGAVRAGIEQGLCREIRDSWIAQIVAPPLLAILVYFYL